MRACRVPLCGQMICRSEFEEIQETPLVGVKGNSDYLRCGNVKCNDQSLTLGDQKGDQPVG